MWMSEAISNQLWTPCGDFQAYSPAKFIPCDAKNNIAQCLTKP
jgi:hypothetical protein